MRLHCTDSKYVLTVLLDLSDSFHQQMTKGGEAHRFSMQVMNHYFRERIGTNDKLIIAQISGEERALLWEGTPLQLRKEFPSSTAFGEFLRSYEHVLEFCLPWTSNNPLIHCSSRKEVIEIEVFHASQPCNSNCLFTYTCK